MSKDSRADRIWTSTRGTSAATPASWRPATWSRQLAMRSVGIAIRPRAFVIRPTVRRASRALYDISYRVSSNPSSIASQSITIEQPAR